MVGLVLGGGVFLCVFVREVSLFGELLYSRRFINVC